ncbi:P27 family phage terminase small subunit [Bacillus mycoides]|uniref:P27 family phage terminase small subunit n=1 Tax=Bacillus mycoides TaxID=1405 RepID=UPI00211322AD|nr:P27 family phage terminase small subunit [Bacillus mycoides]MCQ6530737.1 P27 family phage terminase small subunit [Bacillus mycoides]
MARKSKKMIREELLAQLEEKGTTKSYYIDLVDDYMAFLDIKNNLIKDIKTRGEMVEWQNGEKQKGVKKNDSVVELPKVNKQMLMILRELGLRAVDNIEDDELMEL